MFTERQLMKFGFYAERAHRLALDIAIQAGKLGERGIAVVADETRTLGIKLCEIFDKGEASSQEVLDAVFQLKYLAVNGCIEMLRISNYQDHYKPAMPLAVLFDELRQLTEEIEERFLVSQGPAPVIPRITEKNPVLDVDIPCIAFQINGQSFTENIFFVKEVLFNGKGSALQIENGELKVRSLRVPVIYLDKSDKGRDYQAVILLCSVCQGEERIYALPVDGLPMIFRSNAGKSAVYKGNLPAGLIRECWDCEEGMQMVFLQYGNMK